MSIGSSKAAPRSAVRAKNPKTAGTRRRRNPAGRPTADELARRKLRVMEVATELFVSQGYAETTLLDIAKQAGVATRTLYQHFGDKEALFRDVVGAYGRTVIAPPPLELTGGLVPALTAIAEHGCAVALSRKTVELIRLIIAESARFPEMMREVTEPISIQFRRDIEGMFVQLAEAKLIPGGDYRETAGLFMDFVLGNWIVTAMFGWRGEKPPQQEIDRKIALFIRGQFGAAAVEPAPKPARRR